MCRNCKKLSHVLASTSSGIFSVGLVLGCCAVIAALIAESYLAGAAGAAGVVGYNVWAWRQAELFPISPESAGTAAQVSWWLLALAVLAKIFSS